MTLFYLVRHAEIIRGFGDPGLTLHGQDQAAGVGAFLRHKRVDYLYTSPLIRARQTAEIIAAVLSLPLLVDSRLRERINWGDTPGQTWETFASEWDKGDLDPDYIPPGGLSARQAAGRLSGFFHDVAEQHPRGVIAAVTHAGIINDYLLLNMPPEALLKANPGWAVDGSEVITHASVTTLRWTRHGPVLKRLAAKVIEISPGLS